MRCARLPFSFVCLFAVLVSVSSLAQSTLARSTLSEGFSLQGFHQSFITVVICASLCYGIALALVRWLDGDLHIARAHFS